MRPNQRAETTGAGEAVAAGRGPARLQPPCAPPMPAVPTGPRGRLHPEPESATRSCFQRDRDRIIHAGAFRKLQYQRRRCLSITSGTTYRTPADPYARGRPDRPVDLPALWASTRTWRRRWPWRTTSGTRRSAMPARTRSTAACRPSGGFRHNDQTLRILTQLEQRYAEFDGLNLTWETLEGVVKHNGPLIGPRAAPDAEPLPSTDRRVPRPVRPGTRPLSLGGGPGRGAGPTTSPTTPTTLDDGLRAGLFTVADLAELPLVGDIVREVTGRWPGLHRRRLVHECTRRMMDRMVNDLIQETRARAATLGRRRCRRGPGRRPAGRGVLRHHAGRRAAAEALSCSTGCTGTTRSTERPARRAASWRSCSLSSWRSRIACPTSGRRRRSRRTRERARESSRTTSRG